MLPRCLECTECGEKLYFPTEDRAYFIGNSDSPVLVKDKEILQMLLNPIWCEDCLKPSWVEIILSISEIEKAFAVVKSDKKIEVPFDNEFMNKEDSIDQLKKYFKFVDKRKEKGKCVLCEGTNYSLLGEASVKLRHENCGYGVFKPVYIISSCNGPMQTLMHNMDGHEIGKLSHWNEDLNGWTFASR